MEQLSLNIFTFKVYLTPKVLQIRETLIFVFEVIVQLVLEYKFEIVLFSIFSPL